MNPLLEVQDLDLDYVQYFIWMVSHKLIRNQSDHDGLWSVLEPRGFIVEGKKGWYELTTKGWELLKALVALEEITGYIFSV